MYLFIHRQRPPPILSPPYCQISLQSNFKIWLSIPGGFTPLFRRLETIVPI